MEERYLTGALPSYLKSSRVVRETLPHSGLRDVRPPEYGRDAAILAHLVHPWTISRMALGQPCGHRLVVNDPLNHQGPSRRMTRGGLAEVQGRLSGRRGDLVDAAVTEHVVP